VNLWTTTQELWSKAPAEVEPPPQLFAFRAPDAPPARGSNPVAVARVSYGGGPGNAPVEFRWDAAKKAWLRFQRGTPHVDEAGKQVAAANVIIQMTPYTPVGRDSVGNTVYEAEMLGKGEALVLTGGALVRATWSKASGHNVIGYRDGAGRPVRMAPGQTWVLMPWTGHASVTLE
jgi:hypothetical protein